MAEDQRLPQEVAPPKGAGMAGLLDHPLMKEFGIPLAKQALKKEFGIETHEKELTKRAFGRFVYALRDFIQGTWWIAPITIGTVGFVIIALLWLRKLAGV